MSARQPRSKRALLIVDEAQNLTPRAVEELRMLSNFQLDDQRAAAELPRRPAGAARSDAERAHAAAAPARHRLVPPRAAGRDRDPGLHRAPPAPRRLEGRSRASTPTAFDAIHAPPAASRGASTRSATACCSPAILGEKHAIEPADVRAVAHEMQRRARRRRRRLLAGRGRDTGAAGDRAVPIGAAARAEPDLAGSRSASTRLERLAALDGRACCTRSSQREQQAASRGAPTGN